MCLWRWQRDPAKGFPQPSRINGLDYTDLNKVDEWMRARVVDLAARDAARLKKHRADERAALNRAAERKRASKATEAA